MRARRAQQIVRDRRSPRNRFVCRKGFTGPEGPTVGGRTSGRLIAACLISIDIAPRAGLPCADNG